MSIRSFVFVVLLSLALAACNGKKTIGLDVDVYLHPEAAAADDLLLQTAIQKRLNENPRTRLALVHVRVAQHIVFLDGTVKSQEISDEAARIAETTEVTVNDTPIKTRESVRNGLRIER